MPESQAPRPDLDQPRAKSLPLGLERAAPPDLVPARMINEVLYCERLMYIEWVQGEFADNAFTVEGRLVHRRADTESGALPPVPQPKPEPEPAAEPAPDPDPETDLPGPPPYTARSVWLSSDRLGITAKIDVVEGTTEGTVVPIEYKRGKAPEVPEGAYLPERAQLCAQALLLREHGFRCEEAAMYFAGSRRRVPIAVDEALVSLTLEAAARAKKIASRAEPPPPLDDDARCDGCSLVGICLPDEVNLLKRLRGERIEQPRPEPRDDDGPLDVSQGDPWALGPPDGSPMRRLHPARDDELPLYVQEQGARIGLEGEELVVRSKEGTTRARLSNTSQVSLLGNIQITTQALRALFERGIPVSFFSRGGWYLGRAIGLDTKNVDLRMAQHRAASDPAMCLKLARGFVDSKIRNSRTMLRRNHAAPEETVLFELEQLARKAAGAEPIESLLGLEGTAARVYFGQFSGMLKGEAAKLGVFDLEGRNRRPPRDPINALLSYSYALLTKDFAVTLGAVGLDPLVGFFHQPRFGRPALALDLMEEFRPLVADSVVIGAVNTGVVTDKDFATSGAAVSLLPEARRRMLLAYERRMDQLVTHPLFGYRISYRRVLEVQARLLGRVLLGELDAYPPFRTR
jgi:CRISPR-associated protein Cas1